MKLAEKYILDTNVIITADKHPIQPSDERAELKKCAQESSNLIEQVKNTKSGLVLDAGFEIFQEYAKNIKPPICKPNGLGRAFIKWLHDNVKHFPLEDRVQITPSGDSYEEFPAFEELKKFDKSDRKFIAVANAHPARPKPTIYVADDSKWMLYIKGFQKAGIRVVFMDEEYTAKKCKQKSKGKHA
jgi:hypothetical protein